MLLKYILKRILVMIPTLLVTSALIFTVINLPEGDYFETLAAEMQAQGEKADLSRIEFLKKEYGFDKPVIERYFWWVTGLIQGDMGYSFEYQRPVREVVGDRLLLTMIVSFVTIIFTWIVAFPIGIYSATHQYSWGDYGLTFIGLIGLAVPHFLLALVFMYLANVWFGTSIGGLVDPQYLNQPMSWAKAWRSRRADRTSDHDHRQPLAECLRRGRIERRRPQAVRRTPVPQQLRP